MDSGHAPMDQMVEGLKPTAILMGTPINKPMNCALQHHYVVCAAVAHLDRWVRGAGVPPKAAPMEVTAPEAPGGPARLAEDANGNVKGGVRTPWVDVPTARLSGLGNGGPGFARLVGVTEAYDAPTLARLYPGGKADYVRKFDRALAAAVKAGFILPADAPEARALSAAMWPGG
jgi:hypothetical protein